MPHNYHPIDSSYVLFACLVDSIEVEKANFPCPPCANMT